MTSLKRIIVSTVLLSVVFVGGIPVPVMAEECVILLHGLVRTSNSMNKIERALAKEGYDVINIAYPSRKATIEELAQQAVPEGIAYCRSNDASSINFVSHSLGGILIREYLSHGDVPELARVVMLAPPNQGTEIAEGFFAKLPGFNLLNGPAGRQLGTSEESVPRKLGPVSFELGVIAGTRSTNPLLSAFLPDKDDGKVTVLNTRIEGMCGFVVMPVTHSLMMRNKKVINQVKSFLKAGRFEGERAENLNCVKTNGISTYSD